MKRYIAASTVAGLNINRYWYNESTGEGMDESHQNMLADGWTFKSALDGTFDSGFYAYDLRLANGYILEIYTEGYGNAWRVLDSAGIEVEGNPYINRGRATIIDALKDFKSSSSYAR